MTSRRPDQLDMAIEMSVRRINKHFDEAKARAATWEPRQMVMYRIDIPNDQDRIYGDEWRKHRG